ncbi:MAG: dTDP-4-amino-4,6-dideoxygalactose transaminase [Crocinitomicaceae bacterium]|nr:dTDP-4-amino-4,6-dideoxygalactose transaminase [Crocinitomicaceae bacterium]
MKLTDYSIPFNKPFLTGNETAYIEQAVKSGRISGNGVFTKKCQEYFEKKYGFNKCLLTTSCTDALEMAALLLDIKPGDEVIMPSYTFVSTANPFLLRGAKIVFADSRSDYPGIDESYLESLITPKTKAIVPVYYAGFACEMDVIMRLAEKYNLFVVEDAAQAIDNYFLAGDEKKYLGGIGHLAAFSFHETKNIISGEGGMLVINDPKLAARAEIIWEKGTNRSSFFRGEINKYGWVDLGSSFLPSEIISAFLWAQLEQLEILQGKRKTLWNRYFENLKNWATKNQVGLPAQPVHSGNNAHIFYLVFNSAEQRDDIIFRLKSAGILAVFHYQSLHKSDFFSSMYSGPDLVNSDRYSDCLLRLPLFQELTEEQIDSICAIITRQ